MNNNFVTIEIAKELKELGFDEGCLARYTYDDTNSEYYLVQTQQIKPSSTYFETDEQFPNKKVKLTWITAPLWQQAIDWLLEKHLIHISISCEKWASVFIGLVEDENSLYKTKEFNNTEDARKESILYAIKLIKEKNKNQS